MFTGTQKCNNSLVSNCQTIDAPKDNLTFSSVFPFNFSLFQGLFQPFSVHHNSMVPLNIYKMVFISRVALRSKHHIENLQPHI